jgi:hypothetical protein
MDGHHEEANGCIGICAVALGMVLTTALPASAQETSGSKTCSSSQQYGVTTRVNYSNGTTTTLTKHTLGSTIRTYYGLGNRSTSRVGVSSGPYVVYTPSPYTFELIQGFCMPKAT